MPGSGSGWQGKRRRLVIRAFAAHPTAANLLMAGIMLIGIVVAPTLKRETFPDFTPAEIEIRIPYPGASAEDVEDAICRRLEDAVDGINDVEETRCQALESLAIAVVKMTDGGTFSRFLDDAREAGIDGMIVVDLPAEEDAELCLPALDAGLAFIRLVAPTTDDSRLDRVLTNTAGFVYYISITGITGAKGAHSDATSAAVKRVSAHTTLPVAVGFGIKDAQSAASVAEIADGVVVGSALIKAMTEAVDGGADTLTASKAAVELLADIRRGVDRVAS